MMSSPSILARVSRRATSQTSLALTTHTLKYVSLFSPVHPYESTDFVTSLQAIVEDLLKQYPNVLTLRVRMPIVPSLVYPRNFIAKIILYDKVRIYHANLYFI
jgi:hypothetical protein